MIKMVIFDMAGTVVNEDNLVYKTLQKALELKGHKVSLEGVLLSGAGKEKYDAIFDILNKIYPTESNISKANDVFLDFQSMLHSAYENHEVTPHKNALEIFDFLRDKGVKVVLNTGYKNEVALQLLEKLQWKEGLTFDALINASHVSNSRPAPDMILLAMKKFNIKDAAQVAKVGDSCIDIEEGQNASCGFSIGITTGAQTRTQLEQAHPNFIIDDLGELKELLQFH